jgi:hypothetical protein
MNIHWKSFIDDVPGFPPPNERAVAGQLKPPGSWKLPEAVASTFPRLARLLHDAHTSSAVIGSRDYVLFSWESDAGVSAWLSPVPSPTPRLDVVPAHRTLLVHFGGITERSGEFIDTWLLNTNESLTADEAQHDATFISHYGWAFEDFPGGIPIDLTAYYSISREANGNTTLCHRRSAEVLLFAPDHSFDDVEVLEGCPPYSLYRRRGGRTFTEWVEAVAQQWTNGLG